MLPSFTRPLAVVALGGNALLQRGEHGTFDEQYRNVRRTMSQVADLVVGGQRLLITHGNGPQIGATLIRHELAGQTVPVFPLHACGAETEGFLGYVIQQSLLSELAERGNDTPVVTLVTEVVVDAGDPAFGNPTKPIGPFYTEWQASRLSLERKDLVLREDSGRGYRRFVPSPDPKSIVEGQAIRALVDGGVVVVACGGGGIPVMRSNGGFVGVEAVIDKDLAAERLATSMGASVLAIMTDVDGVFLNYGRDDQRFLPRAGRAELEGYAGDGHFASGSMGPKVEAVVRFLQNGGERGVIGYLGSLKDALEGRVGTQITR
jgi:carbamate kinase